MALTLSQLEAEALQLPPESRAALADKLVESLAESDADDVFRAWKSEAIRRRDEVRSGFPVTSWG